MDDKSRHYEEGAVKVSGLLTPNGFPHRCPYQEHGASEKICKELTSNYQRNLAGCCGTQDSRAFAPCNSQFRKCHKCLLGGKGSKAGIVVDVKRGLCEDCVKAADNPDKAAGSAKPAYRPVPVPRRLAMDISAVSASRPSVATKTPLKSKLKPAEQKPVATMPVLPALGGLRAEWEPAKTAEPQAQPPAPAREQAEKISDVPESVIETCAARVPALSSRNQEILKAALAGKRSIEGLREGSFKVQFGDACNKLEIPKTRIKKGAHSRRNILRRVYARYEQLVAEGRLKPSSPKIDRQAELLGHFWKKGPKAQALILEFARNVKADG